jgi:hypothetical protein
MKQIKMTTVMSSQIESVGYDEDDEILYIEFKKGTVYKYLDVPKSLYNQLIKNDSIGSFFTHNIKFSFEYEKLNNEVSYSGVLEI